MLLQSCIPILTTPTSITRTQLLERAGVCVHFPKEQEIKNGNPKPSSVYIFDSQKQIPFPLGYFPLTFGSVDSWPFPTFEGSLQGQTFVDDKVFGSVLKCTKVGRIQYSPHDAKCRCKGGFVYLFVTCCGYQRATRALSAVILVACPEFDYLSVCRTLLNCPVFLMLALASWQ